MLPKTMSDQDNGAMPAEMPAMQTEAEVPAMPATDAPATDAPAA